MGQSQTDFTDGVGSRKFCGFAPCMYHAMIVAAMDTTAGGPFDHAMGVLPSTQPVATLGFLD